MCSFQTSWSPVWWSTITAGRRPGPGPQLWTDRPGDWSTRERKMRGMRSCETLTVLWGKWVWRKIRGTFGTDRGIHRGKTKYYRRNENVWQLQNHFDGTMTYNKVTGLCHCHCMTRSSVTALFNFSSCPGHILQYLCNSLQRCVTVSSELIWMCPV